MAVSKRRLSKPSRSSEGLNLKVRFDFNLKAFIVATKKRKSVDGKTFNTHDAALAHAKELCGVKK